MCVCLLITGTTFLQAINYEIDINETQEQPKVHSIKVIDYSDGSYEIKKDSWKNESCNIS